jgi:hypothetical protein
MVCIIERILYRVILACILVSNIAKSSSQASEQTAMRLKNIHKSNLMCGSLYELG